jgi:hypothetical protein
MICSFVHKNLVPYYEKWYPKLNKYKKSVPKDISLDEISLLHWFLDDGWSSYVKNHIVVGICSQSFSQDDQLRLCGELWNKFGIKATVNHCNSGTKYFIYIWRHYVKLFFDTIGKPPVKSLAYKWKS